MIEPDDLRPVIATVQALAADGVDGLGAEDLCSVALAARRLRELADHLEVQALGALDDTGHTDTTHGLSTAAWFSRHAKQPTGVGRTQVRTARTLRHLPGTDRAWLDGTITREHVRVITEAANPRIRRQIAELEDHLVGIADELTTFARWRQRIGEVASRLDHEGPDPDDPDHTSATWGRSGLFAQLSARFAGADVELLEQIIEARTDQLYLREARARDLTPDLPVRTRAQLRGLAIVDLLLHGPHPTTITGQDHAGDADRPRSDTSLDLRETDDDGEPVDLDDPASPDVPVPMDRKAGHAAAKESARGPRIGIMVVLRPDHPGGDWPTVPSFDTATWNLTNPDGHHVALQHFASLICDCEVHPLLVDDDGNPLRLGRSTRFATLKQRRAVIVRDGGCAFPGCDCPAGWIEIHHLDRWADGGPTDINRLVGLCRAHHGVTHRNGWAMHAAGDGWFSWTTPSGDSFWSQRYGRQRAGPTPAHPHVV